MASHEASPVAGNAARLPLGPLQRLARRALFARLASIDTGHLIVDDADGATSFGNPTAGPAVRVAVQRGRFYRRATAGGALGAASTYLDGDWDCDDLAGLFRLLLRAPEHHRAAAGTGTALAGALARARALLRANTRNGSRRNIRDHYDLGNDLFRLFLDESMTYSAGVFESPGASLEEAQRAKLDRIGRKLGLAPGMHVLEIGTGWGSFAVHAAATFGCHVTTTTISDAQYAVSQERVRAAGLDARVTLLRRDYRDLEGRFDRIVSIEMIEAVGASHLEEFLAHCSQRLAPDGLMLLQAITTGDDYYKRYRHSVDFIQRYVFPGSHCPSPGALAAAIARAGGLRMTHLEDLSADYVATLRAWRGRFRARLDEVRALGYPERFIRLWDYYLQYCEAGFAERHIGDLQLVLAAPGNRDAAIRPRLEMPGARRPE